MADPRLRLIVNIDGGAKGNPGPAACAAVLRDADDGQIVLERGKYLGETTNNVAEYEGLLLALELATELKACKVEVRSDSELMVRQLSGQYKVKSPGLKPLYERARAALRPFEGVELRHVRREENAEADRLVGETIREHRKGGKPGGGSRGAGPGGAFRLK